LTNEPSTDVKVKIEVVVFQEPMLKLFLNTGISCIQCYEELNKIRTEN
jgi:hypothetical protein